MRHHDWLLAEILAGMQRMLCLSLDRAPAAEMIEGTARAWLDAVADVRPWDYVRDRPCVREAFLRMQRTRTRWPAPADFLAALPPILTVPTAEAAADAEMDRLRADLAHFAHLNALGGSFDLQRCFSAAQRERLGLS